MHRMLILYILPSEVSEKLTTLISDRKSDAGANSYEKKVLSLQRSKVIWSQFVFRHILVSYDR